MNSYQVECIRRSGATTAVRSVVFVIDADSEEQAESIADARLARMRNFPDQNELDIDSVFEVSVL